MFIRVVRARFDPSRAEAIMRLGQEQLTPAFQRLPGFRSAMAGADIEGKRIISISSWDTRAQAATASADLTALAGQFEAVGVQFEDAEIYEVRE
jgi:hypothetical protein